MSPLSGAHQLGLTGICLSPLLQPEVIGVGHHNCFFWESNSGAHACAAGSLPPEPSSQSPQRPFPVVIWGFVVSAAEEGVMVCFVLLETQLESHAG